ncbi:hypothetical protein K458DRAFT_343916 [Lentithecium fluviatile CBS 122367]|uniref:Nascent polypeptide-associated complex subunit alpha-like UBA domain-containing protein n=1 Tax=Lentithecium fluviatile CBS 122367 TaxID=1168545 RepID=A0A6G1ISQ5_9PLEO|nr:hypothetical protein K458DRAFT_343916 [Lentithecium fluviatile CBS 122367]
MAEPQPSNVQEGASTPPAPLPTGTAEDRKAAAALSSLDAPSEDTDSPAKKEVDTKALGEAMKQLSVAKGGGEKRKAVKIEAGDVALLVSELELPKLKATELLRAHDGNALEAIRSFIAPAFSSVALRT